MFGALLALTLAVATPAPAHAAPPQMTQPLQMARMQHRAPASSGLERDQQQRDQQQQDRARLDDQRQQDQTRQMYQDQDRMLDNDGAESPGLPSTLGAGAGHFNLESMPMQKSDGDDLGQYLGD